MIDFIGNIVEENEKIFEDPKKIEEKLNRDVDCLLRNEEKIKRHAQKFLGVDGLVFTAKECDPLTTIEKKVSIPQAVSGKIKEFDVTETSITYYDDDRKNIVFLAKKCDVKNPKTYEEGVAYFEYSLADNMVNFFYEARYMKGTNKGRSKRYYYRTRDLDLMLDLKTHGSYETLKGGTYYFYNYDIENQTAFVRERHADTGFSREEEFFDLEDGGRTRITTTEKEVNGKIRKVPFKYWSMLDLFTMETPKAFEEYYSSYFGGFFLKTYRK